MSLSNKRGRKSQIHVKLTPHDREHLEKMLRGGHDEVRHILRAQMLLHLDQGKSAPEVGSTVGVDAKTARRVAERYIEGGLEKALEDDPRPGGEPLLTEQQGERIIAMVCSAPPKGMSRWSIRLIAQEAVKRKVVPRVGRETIRLLLLSHDLKPWLKKNVVHPQARFRVYWEDGKRAQSLPKTEEFEGARRLPGRKTGSTSRGSASPQAEPPR